MAEEQGRHRRDLEKVVVHGGGRRANAGLALGFIIAVLFLAVATSLVVKGYETAGIVFGSVDIVGLVAVFVAGRVDQRRERIDKAQQ